MKDQPAFPTIEANPNFSDADGYYLKLESVGGLTRRELFAAMAMQGISTTFAEISNSHAPRIAKISIEIADALIAALAKATGGAK